MASLNKKQQFDESSEDKELQKLEEMWDRQIMKGDEEFLESRISSHHKNPAARERDDRFKERKRRGRKM